MEEIIDFVSFEIQNSGYGDKLAAGVVITGGGAMLRHLPQLMKFRMAMDVRIGLPNQHLTGPGKNEINQPMYATSVGLIMRGFDYLETYKKSFRAGPKDDFIRYQPEPVMVDDGPDGNNGRQPSEVKLSLTEKIKIIMAKMFETEDQPITDKV
jgi:cell division ATPase FtsA